MTMRNTTIVLRSGLLAACLAAGVARAQYWETTIPVGHLPAAVLWNPTSNRVYVANTESYDVTIIDGATNAVIGTLPVPNNSYLACLCWNSVENKVYCTSTDPDWLNVIDGAGDTLLHRVRMRGSPTYMAYNAQMSKLYVNCRDDRMVRVYDGTADTLVAEVWLGESNIPYTMLWHPVSNRVFCTTSGNADSVMVIDCEIDVVAERVYVGGFPYAMCWNPTNNMVYIACNSGIAVLPAAGDSVMLTLPADAADMCFAPYPNKIYAVTTGRTYVIDCDSQTVIESLPYPAYVTVCDTVHGKVYGAARPSVPVFDARTDSLLLTIPLSAGEPRSIAWNSTNGRVYIADDGGDVVYVIRDTSVAVAEPVAGITLPGRRVTTMCRGRLRLDGSCPASLLDLTGRQVALLKPGDNDLRSLRAGVYFVRHEDGAYANKVILQD